nr:transcription intermediary factor 1-beta-like [Lytechinus pictus]
MASAFDNPVTPSTCDQCGNPAEDTVRCSVRDSKYLCRGCFRDLPSREDIGEPEWVCDIHATRKVEFFCESCEIGCCKECAGDVHNDHKVVDVVKLTVEIRQKLQAQLEEVNARAEVLSELRNKVNDTMDKIKEAPMVFEKVVREIKEEVQRKLDEEIDRIKVEAQLSIMEKEKQRDQKLNLAKEKADRDIQRIIAIQRDINTDPNMLGKVAEWSNKMEKTKATLLDREQACESANLEIKSMFDASPEKVIRRGRQLNSLIKTSSALRSDQMDIIASCKAAIKADIPEFEGDTSPCPPGTCPPDISAHADGHKPNCTHCNY